MALGLAETRSMIRSAAAGVGNVVVLFGASTGRDGIGGASVLASAEFGEADGDKRPSVQVGDPFAEKKLMECSLELLDRGLLVALQDLGAAGLTSSSAEMASKGGVGIDLDVGRMPLREADMEPFEIMVSESQERMLCVCEPARLEDVLAVCARWEVHGTAIGEVTDTGAMRIFRGDELVGDIPVAALVDDCPVYAAGARSAPPRRSTTRPRRPWPRADRSTRRCWPCSPRPTSPRAGRCSSSTTRSCSRAPCAVRRRPTRPCSRCPTAPRSGWRSTATAGAWPPTPTTARSPRCSSARPTSRASAPSRWA